MIFEFGLQAWELGQVMNVGGPWPSLWQCQICLLIHLYGKMLRKRESVQKLLKFASIDQGAKHLLNVWGHMIKMATHAHIQGLSPKFVDQACKIIIRQNK